MSPAAPTPIPGDALPPAAPTPVGGFALRLGLPGSGSEDDDAEAGSGSEDEEVDGCSGGLWVEPEAGVGEEPTSSKALADTLALLACTPAEGSCALGVTGGRDGRWCRLVPRERREARTTSPLRFTSTRCGALAGFSKWWAAQ